MTLSLFLFPHLEDFWGFHRQVELHSIEAPSAESLEKYLLSIPSDQRVPDTENCLLPIIRTIVTLFMALASFKALDRNEFLAKEEKLLTGIKAFERRIETDPSRSTPVSAPCTFNGFLAKYNTPETTAHIMSSAALGPDCTPIGNLKAEDFTYCEPCLRPGLSVATLGLKSGDTEGLSQQPFVMVHHQTINADDNAMAKTWQELYHQYLLDFYRHEPCFTNPLYVALDQSKTVVRRYREMCEGMMISACLKSHDFVFTEILKERCKDSMREADRKGFPLYLLGYDKLMIMEEGLSSSYFISDGILQFRSEAEIGAAQSVEEWYEKFDRECQGRRLPTQVGNRPRQEELDRSVLYPQPKAETK